MEIEPSSYFHHGVGILIPVEFLTWLAPLRLRRRVSIDLRGILHAETVGPAPSLEDAWSLATEVAYCHVTA